MSFAKIYMRICDFGTGLVIFVAMGGLHFLEFFLDW